MSKIKNIRLENFMSFSKAQLDFDDSNIIVLKGYNNSGKSALIKAFEVALMGRYESKQSSFIRDGENFFRIVVGFTDGVDIERVKRADGKSLYEMRKDGEVIFTTKQGSALAKVTGVPEEIKTYLALTEMDERWLNSATGNEPMLLTDTTGSENFRAISDVLKAEELHKALSAVRTDIRSNQEEMTYLRARRERVMQGLGEKPSLEEVEELKNSVTRKNALLKDSIKEAEKVAKILSTGKNAEGVKCVSSIKALDGSRARAGASVVVLAQGAGSVAPAGVPALSAGGRARALASALSPARGALAGRSAGAVPLVGDKGYGLLETGMRSLHGLKASLEKLEVYEKGLRKETEDRDALVDSITKEVGEEALFQCPDCGKISIGKLENEHEN